ncbi:MAG: hypothetical protein Q8Q85_12555 [Gemmatimonadales bacterium]|nr:hypothetical protein [Gemmatimonadales bacterium]
MKNPMNAALVAALAAFAACTVDARDRERFESSRGAPEPAESEAEAEAEAESESESESESEAECFVHSDCEDGLACVDGACSSVETDAGPPDAAESESESEAEAEAEAESEAEAEAEAEPDAEAPSADSGALEPDAGAPAPDSAASPDGIATSPDAGTLDPDAVPTPEPITIVIEVPEGQTVDGTARFCSTFGGGWACAAFALGGPSGREIRAQFADAAADGHVFNACLRNCDDPFNGVWLANQSNGLVQLADPVVTLGDTVVPESLADNGTGGANWFVDFSPSAE